MSNSKEEEKKEIYKEINKGLAAIGCNINSYGEDSNLENNKARNFISDNYGICNQCEFFFATTAEFKGTIAICDHNNSRAFYLKLCDPILKCSRFEKKGGMSIGEMQLIATIIDPNKKNRAGII